MKRYFGDQVMVPVYVEVEDGERLSRALVRAAAGNAPLYGIVQKIPGGHRRFLRGTSEGSRD